MPIPVYPWKTVYLNLEDATQLLIVGPRIAPGLPEDHKSNLPLTSYAVHFVQQPTFFP